MPPLLLHIVAVQALHRNKCFMQLMAMQSMTASGVAALPFDIGEACPLTGWGAAAANSKHLTAVSRSRAGLAHIFVAAKNCCMPCTTALQCYQDVGQRCCDMCQF